MPNYKKEDYSKITEEFIKEFNETYYHTGNARSSNRYNRTIGRSDIIDQNKEFVRDFYNYLENHDFIRMSYDSTFITYTNLGMKIFYDNHDDKWNDAFDVRDKIYTDFLILYKYLNVVNNTQKTDPPNTN